MAGRYTNMFSTQRHMILVVLYPHHIPITTLDEHYLEFKKKIKVLEYGFMLFFNILEPGVKSTKNIKIEGVHIEYFCSMLS